MLVADVIAISLIQSNTASLQQYILELFLQVKLLYA